MNSSFQEIRVFWQTSLEKREEEGGYFLTTSTEPSCELIVCSIQTPYGSEVTLTLPLSPRLTPLFPQTLLFPPPCSKPPPSILHSGGPWASHFPSTTPWRDGGPKQWESEGMIAGRAQSRDPRQRSAIGRDRGTAEPLHHALHSVAERNRFCIHNSI